MTLHLPANWIEVEGDIIKGHQVASGQASDSPFPLGTIEMQLPYFKEAGVPMDGIYLGTLNVSIGEKTFEMLSPSITIQNVKWSPEHPAETFSLSPCYVVIDQHQYSAYVYYPHPETKIGHFKDNTVLEILTQPIQAAAYGQPLMLQLNSKEILISS